MGIPGGLRNLDKRFRSNDAYTNQQDRAFSTSVREAKLRARFRDWLVNKDS